MKGSIGIKELSLIIVGAVMILLFMVVVSQTIPDIAQKAVGNSMQ